MQEIQRIKSNNSGEIPSKKYNILRVDGIANPKESLQIFKDCVVAILKNIHLDIDDPAWESLLPEKIVQFLAQIDDDDLKNDDLIETLDFIIEDFQDTDIKRWSWYSSKLNESGFEVFVKGDLHPRFVNLIRCQEITLDKITIEEDGVIHSIAVKKDIATYKFSS